MNGPRGRARSGALVLSGVVLFLAVTTARGAEPPGSFSIPPPARTVLKNGLVVLAVERHDVPLVQLRLMVRAGSSFDPAGKGGTAALCARLLKRGTKTRSAAQFAEEAEFVGGTIDVAPGRDAVVLQAEFASRDSEIGFSLLADMVSNPLFAAAEFDKEKSLVLGEILGRLDDTSRAADEAFDAWLYGTHPYGRPPEGGAQSVEGIARPDVQAFYEAYYAPGNAILAVVGDIGASQVAQRAERYFSTWRKRGVSLPKLPAAAAASGIRVLLLDKPDASQSQIRIGGQAVRRADPDVIPLEVASTILGGGFTSWLVDELRVKRGLTYSASSRVRSWREAGNVLVSTFSKNETVPETIKVSLELTRKLQAGTLEEADLERAKSFLAGLYPLRLESPEALAQALLDQEFYGLGADYIKMYQKRVRSVGAESLKRGLRWLPGDDMVIVVVGPAALFKGPLAGLGAVTVRPLSAAGGAP